MALRRHPRPGRAVVEAHLLTRSCALWLTHFYPECDGVHVAAAARARYGGEVVAATDLLARTLQRAP